MPFVRIFLRPEQLRNIAKRWGMACTEPWWNPSQFRQTDRFLVISEHAGSDLTFDPQYLGVQRSDGLVLVQITLSVGRQPQQKRKLFKRLAKSSRNRLDYRRRIS